MMEEAPNNEQAPQEGRNRVKKNQKDEGKAAIESDGFDPPPSVERTRERERAWVRFREKAEHLDVLCCGQFGQFSRSATTGPFKVDPTLDQGTSGVERAWKRSSALP